MTPTLHIYLSQDACLLIPSPPATRLPLLTTAHPLLALQASPLAHHSPLVPGPLAAGPSLHGLSAAIPLGFAHPP